MKVILAKTLGFCAGVKKAVDLIYRELESTSGSSIIMEGPIIHNSNVISDLESKGVSLLENSEFLDRKKIIVRAHGITPAAQSDIVNRGGEIVDGTCPIVKASQTKIKKFKGDGYFIVIAGDRGHAEVIGLVGYAPESSMVIGSISDIPNFNFPKKTLLIAQTTFSRPEFDTIEAELKQRCPTLKTLCTICGATKERQDSVRELAKK